MFKFACPRCHYTAKFNEYDRARIRVICHCHSFHQRDFEPIGVGDGVDFINPSAYPLEVRLLDLKDQAR